MTDGYGGYRRRPVSGGDGDLQEDDVWAVMSYDRDGGGGSNSSASGSRKAASSSPHHGYSSLNPSGSGRRPSGGTASRMIPRSSSQAAGVRTSRQSAPVNIPDWSKIYKAAATEGDDLPGGTHYSSGGDRTGRVSLAAAGGYYMAGDADDDVEDGDGMVPPHEWLAKKVARSQISSFSMFEGVGRTLKGRDLRTVRNAILTKTGFLE